MWVASTFVTKLAVGFRAAVAVTVGPGLAVVDRREIRCRDGQPYHLARSKPIPQAREIVDRANAEARSRVLDGLRQLAQDVAPDGLVAVGLVLGSFRLPSSLESLLASHPACHAAEGEMSREAVFAAADVLGLPVTGVRDRDIEMGTEVSALGRTLGPPWRKDHKLAATVAWLALHSSA
jgi:hypothetical protein